MMQATATNNSHHSSSTQLSQLPSALTARILQRVPLKQRLTCCSLVCRTWRDAAAQATLHIECSLTTATVAGFEAWLRQPGQQVQTLKVTGKRGDSGRNINLVLPWDCLSRLQSLNLTSISLSATALINHSNSGGSTPATALVGSSDGSADTKANNAPLLPHLASLQLTSCTLDSADGLLTVLKQLPGLFVLRLPAQSLSLAAARCVAAMHSLRELQLGQWDENLQLPSSLTWLNVAHSKLPTQLPALTQLLHLHLSCCAFPAAALASLPHLQYLYIFNCGLLAPGVTPSDDSNCAGTAALLDSLLKLTKLQHLHLEYTGLDTEAGSPAAWSALTASTQLTHLYVMEEEAQPVPKGAAAHMFPAGRRLPHLQTLMLHCAGMQEGEWCLAGADLVSIIAVCPRLKAFDASCTVREGEDVSALLQLPASCSSLGIGGNAFDNEAAAVVKQLTQLRSLEWEESEELTDAGLLGLTELTGLTVLDLRLCDKISTDVWEAAGGSEDDQALTLKYSGPKGPVWQQLLSICQCSPDCGTVARERLMATVQNLRRQLAASQAQVQQLQQQLAAAGLGGGGGGLESAD